MTFKLALSMSLREAQVSAVELRRPVPQVSQ